MNRKQIAYFLSACRHRSMQAAADEAGVSRQALSKTVRALEDELGRSLFERTPEGLRPTDFALRLMPHAKSLAAEFDAICGLNTLAEQAARTVTVFALDHIPQLLGAEFFWRFHSEHPDAVLSITEMSDDAALRGLREQACDFAILTGAPQEDGIASEPLFFSRYCVRCRLDDPLAAGKSVTFEDLRGRRLVSKGRAYRCFRRGIEGALLAPGIPFDLVAEATDEEVIAELILRHGAVNLGYDYAAAANPRPGIAVRPLEGAGEAGQFMVLARRRSALPTKAAGYFRDCLLARLSELGAALSPPGGRA